MSATATKKGFDLRMSKKVAELIQVVHLLFMKNHEIELEKEALKDAYEHEIDLVIADAKGQVEELKRQLQGKEKIVKFYEAHQNQTENDQQKIQMLERSLKDEKIECQNVRDLLVLSQKDVEVLRSLQEKEITKHEEEFNEKSKEIDQLKLRITELECLVKFKDSQTTQQTDSLCKLVNKLQDDALHLRQKLDNSENLRETLTIRNKNLEEDVKNLRRELARRTSLLRLLPEDSKKQQQQQTMSVSVNTDGQLRKPNDERQIQRLKEEIQRYRLELSNREINFNLRFADVQPVLLTTRRSTSSGVAFGHFLRNDEIAGQHRTRIGGLDSFQQEPKNQSYVEEKLAASSWISEPLQTPLEDVRPPTSSVKNREQLPQLDGKNSIQRPPLLTKPQPSKHLLAKKYH